MTQKEQIKQELEMKRIEEAKEIKRELARKQLKYFIDYNYKEWRNYDYIFGKWQDKFFGALDRVMNGECKRLIVQVPPGAGKSEVISRLFPCMYLGNNPSKKVMNISYAQSLSAQASRESRALVQTDSFKEIYPEFKISDEKKEASNWETNKGGVYYSFGVGGSVTGKRFHLGIVDDYFKNRQDAESVIMREGLWDFYTSSFYTRKFDENAAIVVVATRWHDDDLIGRLLKKQEEGGDQWELISFPALNEEGESFFPERFSSEYYNQEKKVVGARDFESLYQQDPIKGSGNIFKKEEFKYFALSDIKWEDYSIAIHVDPAWSTKKTSDDIAIAVTARHKITKEIYEIDLFGDQILDSQAYSYIVNLAEKWKQYTNVEFISVEKVSLSKAQDEWISGFEKYLKEQGRFYTVLYHNPVGQGRKEDRIRITLEPMFNRGAIHFRADDTVNEAWQKQELQLLKFPVGAHDDLADVLAQGVIMWEQRGAGGGKISSTQWDDFYRS